jgi:hypothetical protein
MPNDQMESMMEQAFKSAAHTAASQLGIGLYSDEAEFIELEEEPTFGATHMSVRVTHKDGRYAVATGPIVLPTNPN